MNDLSTQPAALAIGQVWRPRPRGPWESNKYTARVLDLKDGWVRYFINEYAPDERLREDDFRSHYVVLVSDAIDEQQGTLAPAETAIAPRAPDAIVGVKLTVEGVETEIDAEVFGKWHAGEPRTYSHPGAARGWEIEDVKHEGTNLMPLLSEGQLDAIARQMQ